MQDNNTQNDVLERPFSAYSGDEPYIFVSYAHRDAELVFPEIKRFHDEGYPIWYDQGLTPGQEWDDEVADALLGSSLLVVFISKNSMASSNVQDEIKLALEENTDIVPVYLEETDLPSGIRLRLSNKHAIFKHSLDYDDYVNDCFKAFDKAEIPKISTADLSDEEQIRKAEILDEIKNSSKHLVYISYSSKDEIHARRICDYLESNGIGCWVAYRDIRTGDYYAKEIMDALEVSGVVLCIFSQNAQKSDYVTNEIYNAFSMGKPILSYRCDESSPEGNMDFYLKNSQWVEGYPDFEDSLDDVLAKVEYLLTENSSHYSSNFKKETPILSKNDLSNLNANYAGRKKIFVCYDNCDMDIADEVCNILEEYNFKCWLKHRDRNDGLDLFNEILGSIKKSDLFLLIYSKNSSKSNFVKSEVDFGFKGDIPFVVFKVDETILEGGLEYFLNDSYLIDASSNYKDYLYTLVNDVYNVLKGYKSKKGFLDSIKEYRFIILFLILIILIILTVWFSYLSF